jgi:1-acyl-sn-glycerol-3-phosphate acyltransferase
MPHAGPNAETNELLAIVSGVVAELRSGAAQPKVGLDSALDKELGIDSLGRAELVQRLESRFDVSLPDSLLATAETPRDLLRALRRAASRGDRVPEAVGPELPQAVGAADTPSHARTLLEALDWHVQAHGDRTHVQLYGDAERPEPISYGALAQGAQRVATGLREQGVEAGQCVAIMLPTSRDYLFSFLGVLMAGGIPVPIYPPARPSQLEEHLRRHRGILDNARAAILITVAEARAVARLLQLQVPALRRVVTAAELMAADPGPAGGQRGQAPGERDIAFIQYTSGSTGNPKGVQLTHANLLANIRAMGEAVQASSQDVFVSWLPLYHDMGLIGAWMGSLYFAFPLVLMSPLAFLARPKRWLWAIHQHRGTLSAGPNFAYELALRKIRDDDIDGLDLSSWRLAFNGAEPVSPGTIRRFAERFSRFGFRAEAMTPVYGLAECSVGLAFPPLGRGPVIDRVLREPLERGGQAVPAASADEDVLEFAACGQPLRGHEVRVVDEAGRELPERREGRLQFRGPSATSGYFRNPEASRGLFSGDWLDSGDLAYLAGGDVYLTSRVKDLIIRAGRNIYPYEVEQAVGEVAGIRKGCVAVFGSHDSGSGTERVVVMAETRLEGVQELARLREQVTAAATAFMDNPPDDVVLAPPHTVLKTSSGKIRRGASRELYERGGVGRRERALWQQLLRASLSSLGPALRRLGGRLVESLYAGYVWSLFAILAPLVWISVNLLPRLSWRWALIRGAARLLLGMARVPLSLEGLEQLPRGRPQVIVANHASYLDGIFLVAALPEPVAFVAKAELRGNFIAARFLGLIGAEFVERFDARRGVADTDQLTDRVRSGGALLMFPEGTFERAPGLLPFRMGGFLVAAQAGVVVLPLVIRGTRSLMRAGSWFPRRGAVRIILGSPLQPAGSDWVAAVRLRDAARAEILRHCGEPDRGQG